MATDDRAPQLGESVKVPGAEMARVVTVDHTRKMVNITDQPGEDSDRNGN
jgi:hypothetical protein